MPADSVGRRDQRRIWRRDISAPDAFVGVAEQGANDQVGMAHLGGGAGEPVAHAMQGSA